MTKWIMKFEVETQATFMNESKKIAIKDTNNKYEVYIQNKNDQIQIGTTFLFVYIIFESKNIDYAEKVGMEYLEDFFDILGFSTCVLFKIQKRIALYDWTPGITSRKGRVYKSIPSPNMPSFILNEEFILTIETLLLSEKNELLKRALRWFRFGISSSDPSDQFQLFWFVIETLTQLDTDKEKVPDKCPHCQNPLYCPNCKKTAYHRPYPIQAIEKIFKKYISDNPEQAFTVSSKTRNALLHGESIKKIESKFGTTLLDIVTIVGKVAWIALLNGILQRQGDKNQIQELNLYQPNNFSFYILDACANVTAGTSENIDLTIDDFPDIKIDIIANLKN